MKLLINNLKINLKNKNQMKKILVVFSAITFSLGAMAQNAKMEKKENCVMMKDGKMVEMRDGKTMPLEKDMTLKNGTVVMTNGTMKTKEGKIMPMKEGECMNMQGKVEKKTEKKKMEKKDTKVKSEY